MLIDLVVAGKETLIVGGGKEPEFKALKLLDGKAKITVVASGFTSGLRRLASSNKHLITLVSAKPTPSAEARIIREREPRVIFISTGDADLDEEISVAARSAGTRNAIVCVVDDPRLNDFNMPAIAKLGDVRVAVSTEGKSPAMAGILRRRIEKLITPEDLSHVRLQGHIREASKKRLKDARARKEFVYKVINSKKIGALLRKGKYSEAERLAEAMLLTEAST
ncbi:MAG: bifunctional precorrin-2 dehydrogenase/sirohydrochlorin ferrochelatase [Thaumarchaeota archaeon]|nr:bifunctional precorrin-2 dehydrogenase/sirohydrochlorin ferrochelatase [Nitrososphaerota archaeon]